MASQGVRLGSNVYIAPTSYVAGDVVLGDDCTVMHHVTIRGDIAPIRIGNRCNVQDGTVIHTKHSVALHIADEVGIGHRAVVHCTSVGPGTLIGIGAIVLDEAVIGAECLIAAGTVVTPGMIIPDGSVVMGVPARVVRTITDADRQYHRHVITSYVSLGRRHARGEFPSQAALSEQYCQPNPE